MKLKIILSKLIPYLIFIFVLIGHLAIFHLFHSKKEKSKKMIIALSKVNFSTHGSLTKKSHRSRVVSKVSMNEKIMTENITSTIPENDQVKSDVGISEEHQTLEFLTQESPIYPHRALKDKIEGTVILELVFNEYGKCIEQKIVQTSKNFLLDQAATEATSQWKIKPLGRPLRLTKTLVFKLQ